MPDCNVQPLIISPCRAAGSATAAALARCMRVLPHDSDTGGFFVALLRKTRPVAFSALSPLAPAAAAVPADGAVGAPALAPAADDAGAVGTDQDAGAYLRRCTREEGVAARVAGVEPYVPLLSVPRGQEVWTQVCARPAPPPWY